MTNCGELDVLVLQRLDDAIHLAHDEVQAAERAVLELGELLLEVAALVVEGHRDQPNFPVTYCSVRGSSGAVKIFSVAANSTSLPTRLPSSSLSTL